MNDFDYENMQKKRLARNAKYKKGGSRSKKCTLPGDYLTKAQKAKLSKTIVSISMKAPISRDTFMSCSTYLKREYLEMCRDQFNAGSANISEDLFGMQKSWLHAYIRRNEPSLVDIFTKPRRMSAEQRERWLAFCREEPVEGTPVETEGIEEESPEIAEAPPRTPTYTADVTSAMVRSGSFTVTGRADEALELLRKLFLGDHHIGEFTLTFNYKED